ncbi:hypothetical protein TGPRC2_358590 [Toxoplasma gondii TgCatPRC2]|uniref:Uncharacterized protein n=1 Tax=Toxoplasma gondii TgCatPRC2 TaxID=1130821 RepID=A0A151HP71_TOXGO|nr:hypothetical protein TGPRC2_358590 [Toxoplasma gondii TgCatPRC2]
MALSCEGQAPPRDTVWRSPMSSRFTSLFSKRGISTHSSALDTPPREAGDNGRTRPEAVATAESLASSAAEAAPPRENLRGTPVRARQDSLLPRPSRRLSFREMYRRLLRKQKGRKRKEATTTVHSSNPRAPVTATQSDPALSRVKSVHFGTMVVHTYPRDAQHGSPEAPMLVCKSDPSIVFVTESDEDSEEDSDENDDCIFANRRAAPGLHPVCSTSSSTLSDSAGIRGPSSLAVYTKDKSSARYLQSGRFLSDLREEGGPDDDSCPPKSFLEYHGDEFGVCQYFKEGSAGRGSAVSHQSTSNSLLNSLSSVGLAKPPGPNDKELENVLMGWCS